jgi:hypothetical protein
MERKGKNKILPLFGEEPKQLAETVRKSIPAQVFLNYFFAINFHIGHQDEGYGLKHLAYFQSFQSAIGEQEEETIRHLLYSCWSTEYALRATAELGSDDYLRYALHWTFPQAYYSIFSGFQAFLRAKGIPDQLPRPHTAGGGAAGGEECLSPGNWLLCGRLLP